MFYNIHTHQANDDEGTISIRNFYTDFARATSGVICSLGLHPWYLEHQQRLIDELQRYARLPNVLAIGECGLDKVCNSDWNLQLVAFHRQIKTANELRKPLIIHCVRAFDELLKVIEDSKPDVPVIIHGFNKKGDIAERLLARGIYLSFGAAILKKESPAAIALANAPVERFFLETDVAEVSISEIYEAAAATRDTTVEDIILQLQNNFEDVFKH